MLAFPANVHESPPQIAMRTPKHIPTWTISFVLSTTLAQGQAFGPRQTITQLARHAISVHATDLDGDGDPDVLSASLYDGKIAWYKNLTADTFESRGRPPPATGSR